MAHDYNTGIGFGLGREPFRVDIYALSLMPRLCARASDVLGYLTSLDPEFFWIVFGT